MPVSVGEGPEQLAEGLQPARRRPDADDGEQVLGHGGTIDGAGSGAYRRRRQGAGS